MHKNIKKKKNIRNYNRHTVIFHNCINPFPLSSVCKKKKTS